MEAKVDVRKLQILNDRINQTIDALNQVRFSVHGLGHTGGLQSQSPFLTQGYGMQQPFGMSGVPGYGLQQGIQGGFPGFLPQTPFGSPFGFQHSPLQGLINPYLTQGLNNPWSQIGSPFGQTPWQLFGQGGMGGIGGIGGIGGGLSQLYGGGIGTGLYHSGSEIVDRQLAEVRANDPFRITQTFPFVVS